MKDSSYSLQKVEAQRWGMELLTQHPVSAALLLAAGGWHGRAEQEGLQLLHPVERNPPASLSPARSVPYSVSARTVVAPLQIT